ncbi:MAG: alkylhydroperoxidase family enzyme [Candidatus Poriferisodalaceae bacterium]
MVRTGLTDEIINQLDEYETSDLPDSWKAALRLTDHISGAAAGPMPHHVHASLKEHFSDEAILMLGALIGVGTGWQRMIEAFGIRPDHYAEGQSGPWEK